MDSIKRAVGQVLVILFSDLPFSDFGLFLIYRKLKSLIIHISRVEIIMHLHTLAEVEEKIRPDIDAVSMWAKENKMKMHPAKTKYSIISTRQKIANSAKQSLDLSVDGMQSAH